MTTTKLIGTGLNGLVGSKFNQLYQTSYEFESIDVSDPNHPIDITNYDQLATAITTSEASAVLHCAAYTDVTGAWQQRGDKQGSAYRVNVTGTKNLVNLCEQTNKHLIHLSTAFVFDGENPGLYAETDTPHPIEWYGQTKWEAEQLVMAAKCPWTILRIDFPFRLDEFPKPDIVRKTVASLKNGYNLFTDHWFGPTLIEDLAKVIDWSIRTQATGLYHASSGEKWSDFDLAQAILELHQLPYQLKSGSLDDYLRTVNRPYQRNTALDISKLVSQIDFALQSVRQGLAAVILDQKQS